MFCKEKVSFHQKSCQSYGSGNLPRYSPGSKTPPQNSAKAKKLGGGGGLPVKARLVRAD